MTSIDIAPWINEVAKDLPEFQNLWASDDEVQSWFDGIRTELTSVSQPFTFENCAKKIIALYLQFHITKRRYDGLKLISVIVPRDLHGLRAHIHDWDGNDRTYPRAVIMQDDHIHGFVPIEEIDIVRSVQKNPTAIRHFAAQIAIHRWAELVRYYYNFPVLARKTTVKKRISAQGEPETETEYERGVRKRGFWYNIASEHLKRVGGQAILEQAEKDAIEPEIAFGLYVLTPLHDQLKYLFTVWELLRDGLKDLNNGSERMKKLKERLEAQGDKFSPVYGYETKSGEKNEVDETDEENETDAVKILEAQFSRQKQWPLVELAEPVLRFLESDTGRRFQQSPSRWRSIQSHFLSWYLGRGQRRVQAIFKKLREAPADSYPSPYDYRTSQVLHPTIWNHYSLSEFVDWSSPYNWLSPDVLAPDKPEPAKTN